MQEREIWFRREMGWATPCHWKGWAATVVGITAIAPFIVGMTFAFDRFPEPWRNWIGMAFFIGMMAALYLWWRWTERHTQSQPTS